MIDAETPHTANEATRSRRSSFDAQEREAVLRELSIDRHYLAKGTESRLRRVRRSVSRTNCAGIEGMSREKKQAISHQLCVTGDDTRR
jgi:hypothetical protein